MCDSAAEGGSQVKEPTIRRTSTGSRVRVGGWSTPVVLPARVAELVGPRAGVVSLPLRLHSSDAGSAVVFDIGEPGSRRNLYSIVMEHAATTGDLAEWLNADLLRQDWPQLWLPPHVRAAWAPLMRDDPATRSASPPEAHSRAATVGR